MNYDYEITKFCEKKIYPNQPEYFNSITAIYISIISLYFLRRTHNLSNNTILVYYCICINGLSSFLYHWYSWYIFKLFDEFSMIIPIWLGISSILFDFNIPIPYIGLLTLYNIILLVFDVFVVFDNYFPIFLTLELLLLFPLFYYSVKKYNKIRNFPTLFKDGLIGITVCSVSGIIWFVTELKCNKYLLFGHPLWHIGFSTGICYIITYFTNLKVLIDQQKI